MTTEQKGAWQLIEAHRLEQENARKIQEDRHTKEVSENTASELMLRDQVLDVLVPMFLDLKSNADELKDLPDNEKAVTIRHPEHSTDAIVSLRWGQLDFVKEDKEFLDSGFVKESRLQWTAKEIVLPRFGKARRLEKLRLPSYITKEYSRIVSAHVDSSRNKILLRGEDHSVSILSFLKEPEVIIPTLDDALRHPRTIQSYLRLHVSDNRIPYYSLMQK